MPTLTVQNLIRIRAAMQAAAREGNLVIFPRRMDTSRDFHALGIQHLHKPMFTSTGLLAARPISYHTTP